MRHTRTPKTLTSVEITAEECPERPATRAFPVVPTPSPTIHLKTLDDVRVEMAKVYREMKKGNLPTQDGTRFVYVLAQIGRVIEADRVAERAQAIERTLKLRGTQ